jgi:hypothetical protein
MILDIMLHAVSQVVRTILQLQSHAPDSSEYPTRKLHTNKREKERKSTTHMQRGPPVAVTMKRERERERAAPDLAALPVRLADNRVQGPTALRGPWLVYHRFRSGEGSYSFFMMEGSYSYRNPV